MPDRVTKEEVQNLTSRGDDLVKAVLEFQHDLAIVEEVAGIEKRTTANEDQTRTIRRWQRATSAVVGFVMVLTVGFGALALKVNHNSNGLRKVQCSFYSLVLSAGYHPEKHLDDLGSTRQTSLNFYNGAYKQIVHDNNQIGCFNAEEPAYVTDPAKVPHQP